MKRKYDRLPTPFGLVRTGVAPDHPEVKSVQNDFAVVMADPRCRFIGNVQIGKDISLNQLRQNYSAVILAYGAASDRKLDIPNENLLGIESARSFVNWYNAHPECSHSKYDLSHPNAVVIGHGNVAIDVARILCSPIGLLKSTDIAAHSLQALAESNVKDVYIIGRRGPVQSAFTIKELREVVNLPECRTIIEKRDIIEGCNPSSKIELEQNRPLKRKFELIEKAAEQKESSINSYRKSMHFKFFLQPVRFEPNPHHPQRVGSVVFERTRLEGEAENQRAIGAPVKMITIEAGLVLKSIGYKSVAIEGVAFDSRNAIVPNVNGRVLTPNGEIDKGLYVSGWLKRGPSGIIATNIVDAKETVKSIVEDAKNSTITPPSNCSMEAVEETLKGSGLVVVDSNGWKNIDLEEQRRGEKEGKPREKFVDIPTMLAIAQKKST